jgi:NADH dehydrogenase
MSETKHKKHIVIVGGGFGGVKAALELSEQKELSVTLVSDRPDFWYYPTLYHTATGASRELSSIPLKHLLSDKPIQLVLGHVDTVDRTAKQLKLASGKTLDYDSLVLALGVVTNYFGIPGLQEFSYGIKSIAEAEELKAHLHQQLTDDRKPDLNYIVIGGGATGIELAGNLGAYLRHIMKKHGLPPRTIHIDLVEAAPTLMPRMPKKVGKAIAKRLRSLGVRLYLGKTVEGETADALTVAGKPLSSHTVIWTAGVANNPFFNANGFAISPHRKVVVDEFLRADGSKDIFVIGDNADTPYSGMAQTAIYDAEFIAHNFRFEAEGRPKLAYRPKKPIYVTPAGPYWAAVEWGKVHIYGWLGWFLREAGDLVAFNDIEPGLPALEQYANVFDHQDLCPTCGAKT